MAYVILGLGNRGAEYAKTRHNAGRMVAELLADKEGFEWKLNKAAQAIVAQGAFDDQKVVVALPETMMNLSGKSAAALVKSKAAAKKLLVIRDELDLPLGTIKMTMPGRGSGGHKGVESVIKAVKTEGFVRVRIGIASSASVVKKSQDDKTVEKIILGKFTPDQMAILKKMGKQIAEGLVVLITESRDKAMSQYHA